MNANLVVCIPVMIVLIASTRKEATTVSANVATKVMDGHANYLVIIIFFANDGIFCNRAFEIFLIYR